MKKSFERVHRVADLIQKSLAQMLLQDMSAERFKFVTITSVNVSRDLSYAKVYVSLLLDNEEEIKKTVDALNHEAKSIRYNLAQAVDLRIVPELKFVYDDSTARGFRISRLIDSAIKKRKE